MNRARTTAQTSHVTVPERSLPLLAHVQSLEATVWLERSMTTFARNVSSFLPGHFLAYARVFHPFETNRGPYTWREQLAIAGRNAIKSEEAEDFAYHGSRDGQARVGTLALPVIKVLLPHLEAATTTSEECYFAIWEGFGGSAVSPLLSPKLELPHRAYHVFSGPLSAALTSFDEMQFHLPNWPHNRSANLWWPADHAWCVATEVDFAWTYIGASRECIDALLENSNLEAVETTAISRW